MEFDEPFHYTIIPYDIDAQNEEKRIRVYINQFLETIVKNCDKKNYLFHVNLYHKYGKRLLDKYPNRVDDIMDSSIKLWEKLKIKFKGD